MEWMEMDYSYSNVCLPGVCADEETGIGNYALEDMAAVCSGRKKDQRRGRRKVKE
jgi:hypothetical protein